MSAERRALWLHGALGLDEAQTPFPWQKRLLSRFLSGDLPGAMDLPTGLGKTKTMAIWLVARALGAEVPRRLIYVVDRRAVVDQATAEAEALRAWIEGTPVVREALGLSRPLPISTLRGQFVDNREWQEDPSGPAIVVGTVDMVGSRLLFQGYGTSRKLRPFVAGLLGVDTLYVVDESHLVPPFELMLRRVAAWPQGALTVAALRAPRVMALSATGLGHATDIFRIDDEDRAHPEVQRRLTGPKRLDLEPPVPGEDLANHLAERALAMPPARIIVFCHKREVAQKVYGILLKAKPEDAKVELLVGGRRLWERSLQAARLTEMGFLAGSGPSEQAAYLVCTSAGEVGIDLDAEHMVGDLVQWERMVQRLGRVNRRGGHRATVVVIPSDDIQSLPGGGTDLDAPIRLLRAHPEGGHDASLAAIAELQRDPAGAEAITRASSEPPTYPPLTVPVVEDWALTMLPRHPGRPEPGPWLRGWIADDPPQASVAWRVLMPPPELSDRDCERLLQAAFPDPTELLTVPAFQVAAWLVARSAAVHKAQKPAAAVVVLAADRSLLNRWTTSKLADFKKDHLARELPDGCTVIVDASIGGLGAGMLDKRENTAADTPATLQDWELPLRVREVPGDWQTRPEDLPWTERYRAALERNAEGEVSRWLLVERRSLNSANEFDRSSGPPQSLAEHHAWTEHEAATLADRLGLPKRWKQVLVLAARWHDQGKAAERWQRAFGRPLDGTIYAKKCGPVRLSVLAGYRHELGSLLHLQRSDLMDGLTAEEAALLQHIVIAHHGRGRPGVPVDACDAAPPSVLRAEQRRIARRFTELQEQWGPWGLAWWEALLRAADQRASRRNQERGGGR